MNQLTEEEFLRILLDREVIPTAKNILQQLEFYIGRSIHNVRGAKQNLEILLKYINDGTWNVKTFIEFKEHYPLEFDLMLQPLYKSFRDGAYKL